MYTDITDPRWLNDKLLTVLTMDDIEEFEYTVYHEFSSLPQPKEYFDDMCHLLEDMYSISVDTTHRERGFRNEMNVMKHDNWHKRWDLSFEVKLIGALLDLAIDIGREHHVRINISPLTMDNIKAWRGSATNNYFFDEVNNYIKTRDEKVVFVPHKPLSPFGEIRPRSHVPSRVSADGPSEDPLPVIFTSDDPELERIMFIYKLTRARFRRMAEVGNDDTTNEDPGWVDRYASMPAPANVHNLPPAFFDGTITLDRSDWAYMIFLDIPDRYHENRYLISQKYNMWWDRTVFKGDDEAYIWLSKQ